MVHLDRDDLPDGGEADRVLRVGGGGGAGQGDAGQTRAVSLQCSLLLLLLSGFSRLESEFIIVTV